LPFITQQPVSQIGFQGDDVTFTAAVSGPTPLSYQWLFNGAPIPSATNTSLFLGNLDPSQAGNYAFAVSNDVSSAISTNVVLTVIPTVPLPIAVDATNLTWTTDGATRWHGLTNISYDGFAAGQSGQIGDGQVSRMSTAVLGPGTFSFWWKVSSEENGDFLTFSVNGVPQASISGEVDWEQQTFYLSNGVQVLQWVYAKNASGSAGLDAGWVDQVSYSGGPSKPFIITPPASQFVLLNSPVTLSVGAAGTPELRYQWRFNSNNIPGATGSAYVLPQVQLANIGSYSVAISNNYGSAMSPGADLIVTAMIAWGDNDFGEGTVAPGATNVVGIAAGAYHNLALRADGSVFAWGDDYDGQCDVPAGLANVVGIAAGGYHSLALKSNGTVVAWGANDAGQLTVAANATNVVAISAGGAHNLALRADGTVVAWGDNTLGQSTVPANLNNVVAIAAGGQHSLALKSDSTVVAWGSNLGSDGSYTGQAAVPAGLAQVVALAAGDFHSLALLADGTVLGWGDNSLGQHTIPAALSKAVAVATGGAHSLAIQEGGIVVAWGDNLYSQSVPPGNFTPVMAIAAGGYHSLACSVIIRLVRSSRMLIEVATRSAFLFQPFAAKPISSNQKARYWIRLGIPSLAS
jgi:hypothetical protein